MDSFRFHTRKMYEDEITKIMWNKFVCVTDDEFEMLLDEYIAFCDKEQSVELTA